MARLCWVPPPAPGSPQTVDFDSVEVGLVASALLKLLLVVVARVVLVLMIVFRVVVARVALALVEFHCGQSFSQALMVCAQIRLIGPGRESRLVQPFRVPPEPL